jgi:hypothetical protein
MRAVLHSLDGTSQQHTACDSPPPPLLKRHQDFWKYGTRGAGQELELPYDQSKVIYFKWVRTQIDVDHMGRPTKDDIAIYQEIDPAVVQETIKNVEAEKVKVAAQLAELKGQRDAQERTTKIEKAVNEHREWRKYDTAFEAKMAEKGKTTKPWEWESPINYLERLYQLAKKDQDEIVAAQANAWARGYVDEWTVGYPYPHVNVVDKGHPVTAKPGPVAIPEPVEPKRRFMRRPSGE